MDSGQSALLLQAAKARGVTNRFDLIAPDARTLDLLRRCCRRWTTLCLPLKKRRISGETQPEAIARFFFALASEPAF